MSSYPACAPAVNASYWNSDKGPAMIRRHLAIAVALVFCATTGCAMCEHHLDYLYPAYGGCCGWHASDHCRAGSAYCHEAPYGAAPRGDWRNMPRPTQAEPSEAVPEPPAERGYDAPAAENGTPPAELGRPQPPIIPDQRPPAEQPPSLTPEESRPPSIDDLQIPESGDLPPLDVPDGDQPPQGNFDLPPDSSEDIDAAVPDLFGNGR